MIRHGKVRRAKLYYLRGRTGKSARIAERVGLRREAGEVATAAEAEAQEIKPAPPVPEAGGEAAQAETPETEAATEEKS